MIKNGDNFDEKEYEGENEIKIEKSEGKIYVDSELIKE
jgi:hypothetical protein